MIFARLIILCAVLWSSVALSQSIDCRNPHCTPEETYCSRVYYEKSDKILNKEYKKLMSALSAEKRSELRKEQRSWLRKLKSVCMSDTGDTQGTTSWSSEFNGCLQTKTEERTRVIKKWAADQNF